MIFKKKNKTVGRVEHKGSKKNWTVSVANHMHYLPTREAETDFKSQPPTTTAPQLTPRWHPTREDWEEKGPRQFGGKNPNFTWFATPATADRRKMLFSPARGAGGGEGRERCYGKTLKCTFWCVCPVDDDVVQSSSDTNCREKWLFVAID